MQPLGLRWRFETTSNTLFDSVVVLTPPKPMLNLLFIFNSDIAQFRFLSMGGQT